MINGLQMPDAVTVLVSTELLAQLDDVWSNPVQISIVRTPGIGSGYEMTARTHTCQPTPACKRCLGTGTVDAMSPKPCPDCTHTCPTATIHNCRPRCCCQWDDEIRPENLETCPGCPEHGEAADVCKVCG